MWISIIVGVTFILIGLAVHVFKWYFLISGYNTMSKERKEKFDIEGFSSLMGIYGYANGIVFLGAGIMTALDFEANMTIPFTFLILSTIYLLIRGQRYDGNIYNKEGKIRKGAGKQLALPLIITIGTTIFVVVILFISSKEVEVSFNQDNFEIHGMYGDTYSWETIDSATLHEELPTIERRTNGSALGSKLKGHFRTSELGQVKLFVDKSISQYIYIESDKGITIFNKNSEDETITVYEKIISNIE